MAKLRHDFLIGAAIAMVAGSAYAQTDKGVAATIGGKPVTTEELDAKVLKTNMKLAQQLYDARKAALDEIILERTYGEAAKAANLPLDQYIQKKINEVAKPVTDADIEAYYNANQARMQGKQLSEMSAQIRQMLASQRSNEARNTLLSQARAKADVKVMLEVPRVEVAVTPTDPIKGNKNAKVTIVEFSEFQ